MKNNSVSIRYHILFFLALLLFSGNSLMAQENGIYELVKDNGQSKKVSSKGQVNDRADFYDLAFNLHPTAYAENNTFKYYKPNKTISKLSFADSKSLGLLYQNNSKYDKAELLIITLKTPSDINNGIDITDLKGLNNLKYVFIKCYFKCSEKQIEDFITANPNVRIFYSVENPS